MNCLYCGKEAKLDYRWRCICGAEFTWWNTVDSKGEVYDWQFRYSNGKDGILYHLPEGCLLILNEKIL